MASKTTTPEADMEEIKAVDEANTRQLPSLVSRSSSISSETTSDADMEKVKVVDEANTRQLPSLVSRSSSISSETTSDADMEEVKVVDEANTRQLPSLVSRSSSMSSETTSDADMEEVKVVDEANTRQLPSLVSRLSSMSSETTSEADMEEIKVVDEANIRQLSRSSSSRASLDNENSQKDSLTKSKSDGDLSRENPTISTPASPAHTPQWSMVSASPITTSPPVQTMGAPSSFDPNRIPASVFSKPANTSEWSMASNDSLFSIHNSFSRDQFKSGELPKIDELNTSPSVYVAEGKSNEVFSLPPLMEVPANEEGSAKSSSVSTVEKEDAIESGDGCTSFAFPVLETDGGKVNSERMVVEEKPEVQEQEVNAAQDSTKEGWFSYFSCCSRCC